MAVPNHKQEFHNHLMDALQSDWGSDVDAPENYPQSNKNKYQISAEFKRVRPREFKEMIKTRINAAYGVIVISHISSGYNSKAMNGRKYDATYSTRLLFGTTALKQRQISGEDRIVYEMERDIMQSIIDHPVRLTGNPIISLTVSEVQNEYTDEDIDFNQLQFQFTARFNDQ